MNLFRELYANEIEVRIGAAQKDKDGNVKRGRYLLYKDARVDMRVLDETFGPWGWQRTHAEIDGKIYCTVSIKSPDGEWVSKSDVGTESNTEAVKGEASDSFKRACFAWGLGRALYTAPDIWVDHAEGDSDKYGARLRVAHIQYCDGVISELDLVDTRGKVRYQYRAPKSANEPKILRESFFKNRERLDNMLAQMEQYYTEKPDSFTILRFLERLGIQCESEAVMTRLREIWMHHVSERGL